MFFFAKNIFCILLARSNFVQKNILREVFFHKINMILRNFLAKYSPSQNKCRIQYSAKDCNFSTADSLHIFCVFLRRLCIPCTFPCALLRISATLLCIFVHSAHCLCILLRIFAYFLWMFLCIFSSAVGSSDFVSPRLFQLRH